jgi:hypothetical protein
MLFTILYVMIKNLLFFHLAPIILASVKTWLSDARPYGSPPYPLAYWSELPQEYWPEGYTPEDDIDGGHQEPAVTSPWLSPWQLRMPAGIG